MNSTMEYFTDIATHRKWNEIHSDD